MCDNGGAAAPGGVLAPSWDELVGVSTWCRSRNIPFHLDGARLWETAAPAGRAESATDPAPVEMFETVEVEEFSEWGIAFAALTNGDIDIMASQTDYVAHDYWTKNMDKLEKISPVSHGLYQAIAVPSYVSINSMEELAANKDMFGGKIIGIVPPTTSWPPVIAPRAAGSRGSQCLASRCAWPEYAVPGP